MTGPRLLNKKIAKLDSGASKTYIRPEDAQCLKNIERIPTSYVGLPDKSLGTITKQGNMTLHPLLSREANTGYVLDNLKSASLLSAGQLCDDGCKIILDENKATIVKDGHVLLEGKRNLRDHLWDIELPIFQIETATKHYANAIIRKDTTKKDLADYLYQCCYSPPLSTFKVAINNGNFIIWPGIDDTNTKNY